MCGIWAFIELIKNTSDYKKLYEDFMNLKPRGPDMSSFQIIKKRMIMSILAFLISIMVALSSLFNFSVFSF